MELFRTLIEQPVFNLLEIIYAIIPGHDLGVAIIIFTAIIRLALWPLVRKQLHHARKMRELQPELKKIKKAAGGDRQKEARLQMEFYKEHEIKPFSTIGTLIIQIPIFLALYHSVLGLIKNPEILQSFAYPWVKNLPWIQDIASNPADFNATFLGLVDLSKKGLQPGGGIYWAAVILAAIAAYVQYRQSKNLLMDQKDARKLSVILKEAAAGKETDQAEMTAAVSKGMIYFMPFMTFLFSVSLPSAMSLYFLTSSGVGLIQQKIILREDVEEMEEIARGKSPKKKKKPTGSIVATDTGADAVAEIDEAATYVVNQYAKRKSKKSSSAKSKKKRRK